jgi:hypothetical protein
LNIKAKPTKYKGILYRSKSEARLAVCFESWGWKFKYEPVWSSVPRFKPDFLTEDQNKNLRVIEYKPVKPNKTYQEELFRNFRTLMQSHQSDPVRERLSCELWCVDFWNDTAEGCFMNYRTLLPKKLRELKELDFSCGKEFRFDLHESETVDLQPVDLSYFATQSIPVSDLMHSLTTLGFTLSLAGDELKVCGEIGKLTPSQKQALSQHKDDIKFLLRNKEVMATLQEMWAKPKHKASTLNEIEVLNLIKSAAQEIGGLTSQCAACINRVVRIREREFVFCVSQSFAFDYFYMDSYRNWERLCDEVRSKINCGTVILELELPF